jgi:DUF971 family protein
MFETLALLILRWCASHLAAVNMEFLGVTQPSNAAQAHRTTTALTPTTTTARRAHDLRASLKTIKDTIYYLCKHKVLVCK